MPLVNDIHSALNPTEVLRIERPTSLEELCSIIRAAVHAGEKIALSGARHAMGAQQFCSKQLLIDMRGLTRTLAFDRDRGLIKVEAGIDWIQLFNGYTAAQHDSAAQSLPIWGFRQKQTGADQLTIGGAVSANAHGRGLTMAPLGSDIESLELVDAQGELVVCSRTENRELFSLVIGGYGLFGAVYSVTLRLAPRITLRRSVRVLDIEEAIPAAQRRIEAGFLYGDFQFDIDAASPDFLTKGVFSGYEPYSVATALPPERRELSADQWRELLFLAHVDKQRAFQLYAQHYLGTDGQLYYSDEHQFSTYLDGYHHDLDRRLGASVTGTEMITELYVPPDRLTDFLRESAQLLVRLQVPVVYGTIRLIEKDLDSFLPWARDRFACVIFNLHVDHDQSGIARAAEAFRALIDLALDRGGSYFLTYHRFAHSVQLLRAYPEMPEFLRKKQHYDPGELFLSDWYLHYAKGAGL